MSGFKVPAKALPAAPAPAFDADKAAEFIRGGHAGAAAPPAPPVETPKPVAPAVSAEVPEEPKAPALVDSGRRTARRDKIVVADARFTRLNGERMTEQFVVRFTKREREALDVAFSASGYRYLHHYVKSLIMPSLKVDGDDGEGG